MTSLKKLRIDNDKSQVYCANLLGVSLRSYITYENDESKINSLKYHYLFDKLNEHFLITEEKGILSLVKIKEICSNIMREYDVDFAILFGSYAKNQANCESDVDILISTNVNGLAYFGLVEHLRESLHKKVDLLNIPQLVNNKELINEIFKYGVKIYERKER